eukprot:1792252-Prymnesium_polylepis.1
MLCRRLRHSPCTPRDNGSRRARSPLESFRRCAPSAARRVCAYVSLSRLIRCAAAAHAPFEALVWRRVLGGARSGDCVEDLVVGAQRDVAHEGEGGQLRGEDDDGEGDEQRQADDGDERVERGHVVGLPR